MNFNKEPEEVEVDVDVEKNIVKSEIRKRIDEINNELDKAYHIQETLADRLTGILSVDTPSPGRGVVGHAENQGVVGHGENTASPVANALKTVEYKLQGLTEKYTELIQRLEI